MNADPKGMARQLTEAADFFYASADPGGIVRVTATSDARQQYFGRVERIRLIAATLENVIEPAADLAGATDGPGAEDLLLWMVEHEGHWSPVTKTVRWAAEYGDVPTYTLGTDWRDAITKAMSEERAVRVAEAASEDQQSTETVS